MTVATVSAKVVLRTKDAVARNSLFAAGLQILLGTPRPPAFRHAEMVANADVHIDVAGAVKGSSGCSPLVRLEHHVDTFHFLGHGGRLATDSLASINTSLASGLAFALDVFAVSAIHDVIRRPC
jgi:hypothetical protein